VKLADFKQTLSRSEPPAKVPKSLAAMWWAGKGDWNEAHRLVMDADGQDAAWIHAYLHRVEGDLDNARYWYREAHRRPADGPFQQEWEQIVSALLDDVGSD
jgi:hypothetical protein